MNNGSGHICKKTKKEITLPLMDKNGMIIGAGEVVFQSELYKGSKLVNSLHRVVRKGDFLALSCEIYTAYSPEKNSLSYVLTDSELEAIGIENCDLLITSEGTRILDLEIVRISDEEDIFEYLDRNYPLN